VLRNRYNHRLVVHRGVLRAQAVGACRHTRCRPATHNRADLPVNERIVNALEENETVRVERLDCVDRSDRLDDYVCVPDDRALRVELLRRGEVVLLRVGEESSLFWSGKKETVQELAERKVHQDS
jgi:hypothetical protein